MSDRNKTLQELIARIWKEEDFKQKFISDPKGTLSEAGINLPADVTVKAHFNSPDTVHIVIPLNPAESELSDQALDGVSGGEFTFVSCPPC